MGLRDAFVVDQRSFALVSELELRKATRIRYPVSLLDLLPDVDGEPTDHGALAEQLARAISPILRDTDLIGLSPGSASLQVLLIDASLEALDGIIHRIFDEIRGHLFQTERGPKAVTLSVGGACFPTTASTTQHLVTQAEVLARKASRERPAQFRYRLP